MPDISMCKDTDCPKRQKCFRFLATPSRYMQAYFTGSPRKGEWCEYFWQVESKSHLKRLSSLTEKHGKTLRSLADK